MFDSFYEECRESQQELCKDEEVKPFKTQRKGGCGGME
jgi:hypothetical protein